MVGDLLTFVLCEGIALSVSSVIGTSASNSDDGRLLERNWLRERFQQACEDGTRVIVFAAEPGMGKSSFLKKLANDYADSIYVEIRRPLFTNTASGFWGALLAQLDL
ncbi:TPA: hypothetical protein DD394_01325, partial [bacterium UBP9_UBA11836]|nr:hypothetical protein [bacterium UBP9_UBA11836]